MNGVDGKSTCTLVSRIFASWNQLDGWLRQLDVVRSAACSHTLIAIYVDYLALCVIVRLKRRFMKISRELSDEAVLREIGSRLATVRLAQNLTQAALADEAGLSKRTVERLESGEVAARLSGLVRVCRVLDMVDRLEALVPSPTVSPVEQLKLAGRHRKRASGRRRSTTSTKKKWKWGDES
jgi:transcriptional regulator with XRE-family HTH domain